MSKITICLVQTCTLNNPEDALKHLEYLFNKAEHKCDLMVLPETVNFIGSNSPLAISTTEEKDIVVSYLRNQARVRNHDILIGSVSIRDKDEDKKLVNRSIYVDKFGSILARYDKIHLFDAIINTSMSSQTTKQTYKESAVYTPGSTAVVLNLPWLRFGTANTKANVCGLGMTVCYDLRQPQLYRSLANNGAKIFTIPSAFTMETGKKHWQTLCQARAIENGCFVLAPAQCGKHTNKRETWGHSLIIDPNGNILLNAEEEIAPFYVDIELQQVSLLRQAIPALTSQKEYGLNVINPT